MITNKELFLFKISKQFILQSHDLSIENVSLKQKLLHENEQLNVKDEEILELKRQICDLSSTIQEFTNQQSESLEFETLSTNYEVEKLTKLCTDLQAANEEWQIYFEKNESNHVVQDALKKENAKLKDENRILNELIDDRLEKIAVEPTQEYPPSHEVLIDKVEHERLIQEVNNYRLLFERLYETPPDVVASYFSMNEESSIEEALSDSEICKHVDSQNNNEKENEQVGSLNDVNDPLLLCQELVNPAEVIETDTCVSVEHRSPSPNKSLEINNSVIRTSPEKESVQDIEVSASIEENKIYKRNSQVKFPSIASGIQEIPTLGDETPSMFMNDEVQLSKNE